MHILIVAHSEIDRHLLRKMCERLGCTVSTVDHGPRALDFLSNPCQRPDLILIDVVDPIMSGPQVTHILRTQPPFTTDAKLQNTPIIGLLEWPGTRGLSEDQRFGFSDFISKPARISHLRSQLRFWARKEIIPPAGLHGQPDILMRLRRGHRGPRSRI
ncbi:CheY-like protein [Aspergillus sclerotiicarbonarius CBS 121057]|uniref:Stress response regulator protein 1 n=1 Tax=Aspergillus sclerotiicarbonarius (strain CBS 121057 / IBT 28362) TaxID=1448318 RepID=A0A319FEZ3_ASPSB|nr:CheY-like protein [Aspergillus sclerotiicarbonarius CBS 121057]